MLPLLPKITLTPAQRDAVCDVGLDCLSDSDGAYAAGYLDREFSEDLRQMLEDLSGTGSGAVELEIIRPDSFLRMFNELLDRAAADTRHPDRHLLIREVRDHVFATALAT